jgi:hypothetical protein
MISYVAGDLHPRKKPKQPSTQKQKIRLAMSLESPSKLERSHTAQVAPCNLRRKSKGNNKHKDSKCDKP